MRPVIYCTQCGRAMRVDTRMVGRVVHCPHCERELRVPFEIAGGPPPTAVPFPGGGAAAQGATTCSGHRSGHAVASFVLGLCGLVNPYGALLLGILAIHFSQKAKRVIALTPGLGGDGLAATGFVFGIIDMIIGAGMCTGWMAREF